MNQYGFRITSGKRDMGIWWTFGWDEEDAKKRLSITLSGTALDLHGYDAVVEETRIFGETPKAVQP